MRRAGKARLYRTLAPANSVAAADLGILQSAGNREHRARLHALGAKLDLHPPGQVFLRIHFHLSRGVQEARRHANLANEESIGVRGYDAAHLRKERRSSAGAAPLEQPRHVDVGDRSLLYREIALELAVQDQSFREQPLHGVHTLAVERPSGKERRRDFPRFHLVHRELALHAPAARPSEAHVADQSPAVAARFDFAQRELAPRHGALCQELAQSQIRADGQREIVGGDFDSRSPPLGLQLHRELALCVVEHNRFQRTVRRKACIDFQCRQIQLRDVELQCLGRYALDPEGPAPALVLQQRREKFPRERRVFQREVLERYPVLEQGGDHRGRLDDARTHRVLFSDDDFLELQLRRRQQRQVDGADLDRLSQPGLRRLFVWLRFEPQEAKCRNRHDHGHEQHQRELLSEAAGFPFFPDFPRGKRGFAGGPDGLLVAPPCFLSGPFLCPRRLAGLCGFLRRLFLFPGESLLLFGALLLFLGTPGLLLGFATAAVLFFPALLFVTLPLLGFAPLLLFLLPQGTLQGFAFLGFPAPARFFLGAAPQLFLAPGSLFLITERALLGLALGAHFGFDLCARFGFDARSALALLVLFAFAALDFLGLLAPAAFHFLAAHSLFDLLAGALLHLAPQTLLGVPAHLLLSFALGANLGLAPGFLLVFAPFLFLDLPADTLLGLAFPGLLRFDYRSRYGFATRLFLGFPALPLFGLAPRLVERVALRRKPGPRREPCLVLGLRSRARRKLGLRLRRGFLACARSLSLAGDVLSLSVKFCVLARP